MMEEGKKGKRKKNYLLLRKISAEGEVKEIEGNFFFDDGISHVTRGRKIASFHPPVPVE